MKPRARDPQQVVLHGMGMAATCTEFFQALRELDLSADTFGATL